MEREQIKYKEYLGDGKWHHWGYIDHGFVAPVQSYRGNPTKSYMALGIKDAANIDIYLGDKIRTLYKCAVSYDNDPHTVEGYITWNGESGEWLLDLGHVVMPLCQFELEAVEIIGHEATDEN